MCVALVTRHNFWSKDTSCSCFFFDPPLWKVMNWADRQERFYREVQVRTGNSKSCANLGPRQWRLWLQHNISFKNDTDFKYFIIFFATQSWYASPKDHHYPNLAFHLVQTIAIAHVTNHKASACLPYWRTKQDDLRILWRWSISMGYS